MRIIQTNYNALDFQSRIFTIDMKWGDFKSKILKAISNNNCIKDEELGVKSETMLQGTLIPKFDNGLILQNDNFHLMIRTTVKECGIYDYTQTTMFYLISE